MKKVIFILMLAVVTIFATVTIIKVKNYVIYEETGFPMNPTYIHENLLNDQIDWAGVPTGMYHYTFTTRNGNWGGLYIDYYHINSDTVWSDSVSYTVNYTIDPNTVDSTKEWGVNRTIYIASIYLDTLGQFSIGMRAEIGRAHV